MFLRNTVAFIFFTMLLATCNSGVKEISEKDKSILLSLGDSISIQAQNTLLQNVAGAMQKGGADYAVEFCNINANPIMDSVALKYKTYIQRLSDKNRNPANAIHSEMDSLAWAKIKATQVHLLEQDDNGNVYYYKPIKIAMPTCIKCHGGKEDIAEITQNRIAEKYPHDKAIGYKMGDLRGMWKIQLKIENDFD